jgi:hypothetical protein
MADSLFDRGDERDWRLDAAMAGFDTLPDGGPADAVRRELEPGWKAARSLMQLRSDELLTIMLRPSFRPVRDLELVPVVPCMVCKDGGLRTAGTVRGRRGRELVRACDTCGSVRLGEKPEVH